MSSSQVCCPVCGGELSNVPATLVEDRGMIVAGGSFALLTGIEGTVMRELVNSFPNVVSKDALHRALYELDPEGGAEPKIVDVIVCKIRKKVKPLGIEIDTSWGRGYALSVRVHSSSEAA